MNTTRRAAAVAVCLIVAATPAASGSPAVPPAQVPWPPPSTHGRFLPYPENVNLLGSYPSCGAHIDVSPGDVFDLQYRALVTDRGETVVEYRGDLTLDVRRLPDGADLDEVGVSASRIEVYDSSGTTVTYARTGPAIVAASNEVEAQAFADAGLPEAFLFLSGDLMETVTYETAPTELGQDVPPMLSAEITEDSTAYVFDLCDLLDQAPKDP
ncbi:hypothetical protein [Kocuria aegyptia]|uniref:Uncharacterized protein n=1 Tax=Kocuria aegyptia TaxID=330943 RepID=A0ABP4W4S7_9MICC